MSLHHPRVISSSQDFLEVLHDRPSLNEWVIGPYHLSLNPTSGITSEQLCLFDFPVDLEISLNDMTIPMSVFDYLNPLILTRSLEKRIEIFNSKTGQRVLDIPCWGLYHPLLPFDQILEQCVYYPPGYSIKYNVKMFARSNQNTSHPQISTLLTKYMTKMIFQRSSAQTRDTLAISNIPGLTDLADLALLTEPIHPFYPDSPPNLT